MKTAVHHLIPGNASLLKSKKLMKYLHIDGMAEGNIGYNVNNHRNGVWLTGNYAFRGNEGLPKWEKKGAGFINEYGVDPKKYAFKAIEELGAQFHDSHEKYSEFVTKTLDLIAKKMNKTGNLWCPKAHNKPDNPHDRQLYMIVNRLHVVSDRLRRFLIEPAPQKWKKNIWTSKFSKKYMDERLFK